VYATGSKIDLDSSLRLQILRVKRDLLLLLFPPGLNQQWIAKIVVMKMKRRLVVSISIGLDDLPVGNSRILDENVYIRAPFPIRPAYKPFDREPMVSFMRRRNDCGVTAHHCNGKNP